jgi:diguanylate cyclase (GGDEF)-like protein
MRFLADHDPLTQLPNRRAFMRELERTVSEAIETRQPLSLVILDLDDLKALNDRHGHANGDDCLVRIGRLLKTELRPGDQAFRIGGDEFAVLLAGADEEAAKGVARRFSEALERSGRSSMLRVEASFGIAERRRGIETPDELLREADEAMYRAKNRRKLARTAS